MPVATTPGSAAPAPAPAAAPAAASTATTAPTAGTSAPGRLNRTLLLLLGLVVAAVGVLILLLGLGVGSRVSDAVAADKSVLPASVVSFLLEQPWVPAAVAASGVLLALLGLRWLLVQLPRRSSTGQFRIQDADGDGRGVTRVDADTVADAVAADIEAYPGVSSARADLTGSRQQPTVTLTVAVDPDTDISALQERIREHAIARLARAVGAESVATRLLMSVTRSSRRDRVS